jgi:hypothetical protein
VKYQGRILGRFEDFRKGHLLYILDQTYCYTNQRFLQSRRISSLRLRLAILKTTVKFLCTHAHHRNRHLRRAPNISTFNRDKPCSPCTPSTVNSEQSHISILHFNPRTRALFSQIVQQQHPTLLIPPRLCPPFAHPQHLPSSYSPSACTFLATYSSPSPRPGQTSLAR